jgi:hypothetical protein
MTRYTVVWHNTAWDELARLWLASSDKQAMTDAANETDRQLAVDPDTKGSLPRDDLRELVVHRSGRLTAESRELDACQTLRPVPLLPILRPARALPGSLEKPDLSVVRAR